MHFSLWFGIEAAKANSHIQMDPKMYVCISLTQIVHILIDGLIYTFIGSGLK
jgi:hypothetical protein